MAKDSGMGSILKYGLFAAGAYILYRSGIFNQITAALTPAAPGAPASPTGGGGNAPGLPTSPTTTTNVPTGGGNPTAAPGVAFLTPEQIDALTKKAAAGDVVAVAQSTALGTRYTVWQWNWFREQAGLPASPSIPGPGTPTDQNMTAAEYMAVRAAAGLGGISLGGIPLQPGVRISLSGVGLRRRR